MKLPIVFVKCWKAVKRCWGIVKCVWQELLEVVEELKGEMVVIIEGSKEEKDPGEDQAMPLVHDQIKTYIDGGLTTNEAIKRVAKERGLSKNDLYKEFHGLS